MVSRYDFYGDGYDCYCSSEWSDDGDYVKYEDYKTLQDSHRELLELILKMPLKGRCPKLEEMIKIIDRAKSLTE